MNVAEMRGRERKGMCCDVVSPNTKDSNDITEIWNIIQRGINEAAGKVIGREERQRNGWFCEECQIILEDKKRLYSKVINRHTRQNEQYTGIRKKYIKYFDKKVSKLGKTEIAYNSNAAKKCVKKIVKKGYQTRYITDCK